MFGKSPILVNMKQQLWATRIYLFLLIIAFSMLTIYSSLDVRRNSVTVHNPSQQQFESLYSKYTSSLSCPCSQLSIRYSSIISIQPRFHQICSSDFVRNDGWLRYFELNTIDESATAPVLLAIDFRGRTGFTFFWLLQNLCKVGNEIVEDALKVFNNIQLVSNEPLSNASFQEQVTRFIEQFEEQVCIC